MNKKLCISCRAELDFDSYFCNECGMMQDEISAVQPQMQTKQCPKCFNSVNANVPFCSKCGANFSSGVGTQPINDPHQTSRNPMPNFGSPSNLPAPYQPNNQYMQPAPMQFIANNQFDSLPSQLNVVFIFQLIVGILEIIGSIVGFFYVLAIGIMTFGIGLLLMFIPLIYLAVGICSLISGIKGTNKNPSYGLGMFTAISQMCMLLMCDVLSFTSGLIGVIFLNNDESKRYFARNK